MTFFPRSVSVVAIFRSSAPVSKIVYPNFSGLSTFPRALNSHQHNIWQIFCHIKKIKNAFKKLIISRILYFGIYLSRILVAQNLKRGIFLFTIPKILCTKIPFLLHQRGFTRQWLIYRTFGSFQKNFLRVNLSTQNDFSPFVLRLVLSLWHFPYPKFLIFFRTKAVSFSPFG